MDIHRSIDELIYRSCIALDEKNFAGYLDLCDAEFHYRITAYSPEIRKHMTWLEHDRAGMQTLFNNLPRHNSDHSPVTRHATVYTVALDDAVGEAQVITALQVFRTTLDGGASDLFAVGKMHDIVRLTDAGPKLRDRDVRLDTRMFGFGYHIPF